MINLTEVKLYQKVTGKNTTNGQIQNTFPVVAERILADVQAQSLTSEDSSKWGQTDLSANSRIVFIAPNSNARLLDRIVDSVGDYFEIRGINPWPIHWELLLIPVVGATAPIAVDGVSIAPATVTLAPLATQQLTATFTPVAPTNTSITWTSSDITKATVSSTGLVTALVTGSVTV